MTTTTMSACTAPGLQTRGIGSRAANEDDDSDDDDDDDDDFLKWP